MPPVHTQRSEPATEDEFGGHEEQISMCSLLYVFCRHGLQEPLVISSHPHISPAGQLHDVSLCSDIAPVGHAVQLRAPSWLTEFTRQLIQVISVSFRNIPARQEQSSDPAADVEFSGQIAQDFVLGLNAKTW